MLGNDMTGPELKEIRKSLGMGQEEFGKLFGYHQPQVRISEFERGVRVIPQKVINSVVYLKEKAHTKSVGNLDS